MATNKKTQRKTPKKTKLKTPIIIVNFKNYKTAIGKNALKLAKACEKAMKKTKANISIAVPDVDICKVSSKTTLPVLAQHVDYFDYGSHTGFILPEDAKENGAIGSLINHSERKLDFKTIKKTIERLKENKMVAVVCIEKPSQAEKIAKLNPDFIAIEPPELIGGDVSVSTAQPDIIVKTVEKVKKVNNIPVLCGAGVKTKEDVEKAIELGAEGILIASGITKAKNPQKALEQLIKGL